MRKIAPITLAILFVISIALLIMYIVSGSSTEGGLGASPFTGYIIAWGVGLLAIAVLVLVGFAVAAMIENPKILIRSFAIIGAAAVLFFISYYFSSDTPLTGKNADVPATMLKWVGTGLNLTYILGVFALGSVIFSEVVRTFR